MYSVTLFPESWDAWVMAKFLIVGKSNMLQLEYKRINRRNQPKHIRNTVLLKILEAKNRSIVQLRVYSTSFVIYYNV